MKMKTSESLKGINFFYSSILFIIEVWFCFNPRLTLGTFARYLGYANYFPNQLVLHNTTLRYFYH